MHGEKIVADIGTNGVCTVLDRAFLPFSIYLEDTAENDDLDIRMDNLTNFYYWCATRVLTLDRVYAKEVISVSITRICIFFSNARYSAAVSATFGVIRRSATGSLERFKNIATWSLTPHSAKRRLKYSATSYLTPIAANTTANGSSSFSPSPRLACSQSGRQAHHAADRCLKRSAVSVHGSKSSVHRSQRYRF